MIKIINPELIIKINKDDENLCGLECRFLNRLRYEDYPACDLFGILYTTVTNIIYRRSKCIDETKKNEKLLKK